VENEIHNGLGARRLTLETWRLRIEPWNLTIIEPRRLILESWRVCRPVLQIGIDRS
jgi:hypothetical protein